MNEQIVNLISSHSKLNIETKMTSKCRQNYHEETEALVNKQINIEQSLYYQYLALVSNNLTTFEMNLLK